ncbi:MAG: thioredoxin family protein [Candidatus Izemoplasmatales bacterium]|jgi:thioredoxin-like negative regulator of GroEL|nr:thioredoxin family protein [Candidatus Izemoplasmatales bacterium]
MIEYNENIDPLLNKGIVILEFYAKWCGTCRQVSKSIAAIESKLPYTFVRIDSDRDKLVLKKYHVQGIPVVLVLKDGVEVDRTSGSLTVFELELYLNSVL